MAKAKLALFASGLFFGGALDHVILGVLGSGTTPYGLHLSVTANWLLALGDAVVALGLYQAHRRWEPARRAPMVGLTGKLRKAG